MLGRSKVSEGEFGIYREKAGGNYYISIDQVLNGLRVQRLKLFKKLDFEPSNQHVKECFRIERCQTRDVERGTSNEGRRTRDSNLYSGLYYAKILRKNTECPQVVDVRKRL